MMVVVKVGTRSVTSPSGVEMTALARIVGQLADLRRRGHRVILVSSGAVAVGVSAYREAPGGVAEREDGPLRGAAGPRTTDTVMLQALAAIGQHRLMQAYDEAFSSEGLLAGQVLLAPLDFAERSRYLHARDTLGRLLELGVMPVVNENDAIADDEIRFGDNDRLAALVSHLMRADLMVLLTDLAGLFTADPRRYGEATLIEEVREIDHELEEAAGGPADALSRGGMASKLAAANMASWSGVTTVIAAAERPGVLLDAVSGVPGVGTVFVPRERKLPARKLWIAFALRPRGRLVVDAGAEDALVARAGSLLPAGVTAVGGSFAPDDAVEITRSDGTVFAKGIARVGSARSAEWMGRRTSELPEGFPDEVVNRDDLVVLQ